MPNTSDSLLTPIAELVHARAGALLEEDWIGEHPDRAAVTAMETRLRDLEIGSWPDEEDHEPANVGISYLDHLASEAVSRSSFEDDPAPAYADQFQRVWRTVRGLRDAINYSHNMCYELEGLVRDAAENAAGITDDDVAEHADALRTQLTLIHRKLGRLVEQARRADAAKAASPDRVTFKDVDRLLRGQLKSMGASHRAGDQAPAQAWEIIKVLRPGRTAKQVAKWLYNRHWEDWATRKPTAKGFYDNRVRYTAPDGTVFYGSTISEDDSFFKPGHGGERITFIGEPGPDKQLVNFDQPKYRSNIGQLRVGQTVFLPAEDGEGFDRGREILDLVTHEDGSVEIHQENGSVFRRGEDPKANPPIVSVWEDPTTQVIVYDEDRVEYVPVDRLERGRQRYGLIEDGRFDELKALAEQFVAEHPAETTK